MMTGHNEKQDQSSDAGLESRFIAHALFTEIFRRKHPMDQVLARDAALPTLEPRDRAFVKALLMSCFRHIGQIDAIIAACLDKPGAIKHPFIKDHLRLGIAQLVFLKTPAHAAIHSHVELISKQQGMAKAKGLVNAVLRRVQREGGRLLSATKIEQNYPEWLYKSWVLDYGAETAFKILKASLSEAPTDLVFKSADQAEEFANTHEAQTLPTGNAVRLFQGGSIPDLEGFEVGDWWVQDLSASLPVHLLGDLTGKRIVDLCAAPGGKTAQLCARGAEVLAIDRSAKRMVRFEENMKRLGFDPDREIVDAALWQPKEQFDVIVLDAPCSATGTLRRHPDMPFQKAPEDIERLVQLQTKLLDHAAQFVKAGGHLVYCTCSLQKLEGEGQIEAFLKSNSDFINDLIQPSELSGLEEVVTKQGFVRALPFHLQDKGGMDGFFVARLKKKA